MNADSYVTWDLETLRLSYEVPGGWKNVRSFGLAVAVTQDDDGRTRTWFEEEAGDLIEYLERFPLVVGFNNRKFDNVVLSAYGNVSGVDKKSLDLLEDIGASFGRPHPVSLDRLSEVVLGERKLLDDATEAVRLWRSGRPEDRDLVVRYCTRDVELTLENFRFGRKYGYVLVPVDEVRLGKVPLVARVPISWGREGLGRLVHPEPFDG